MQIRAIRARCGFYISELLRLAPKLAPNHALDVASYCVQVVWYKPCSLWTNKYSASLTCVKSSIFPQKVVFFHRVRKLIAVDTIVLNL